MAQGKPFNTGRALTGLRWLLTRDLALVVTVGTVWAFVAAIAVQLTRMAYGDEPGMLSFTLLVSPLFVSALTHAALSDEPLTVGQTMRAGVSRYASFLLLIILIRVAVYTGIMFLVLPGLVVIIVVACAAPILAWEEPNPFRALLASFQMIWPRFWKVALAYAAIMGTSFLLLGLAFLTGLVDVVAGDGLNKLVASAITASVFHILSVYLSAAIYMEAKYSDGAGDNTLH